MCLCGAAAATKVLYGIRRLCAVTFCLFSEIELTGEIERNVRGVFFKRLVWVRFIYLPIS